MKSKTTGKENLPVPIVECMSSLNLNPILIRLLPHFFINDRPSSQRGQPAPVGSTTYRAVSPVCQQRHARRRRRLFPKPKTLWTSFHRLQLTTDRTKFYFPPSPNKPRQTTRYRYKNSTTLLSTATTIQYDHDDDHDDGSMCRHQRGGYYLP